MDLLEAWSKWEPNNKPFILDGDVEILKSVKNDHIIISNWPEYIQKKDFCPPSDYQLHLSLIPQPFTGDIKNAKIYILLLNPGVGPSDYFGEYSIPEYRNALLSNLKQEFNHDTTPYFFLDPRFSWHGGFAWWNAKLILVLAELAKIWNKSLSEVRKQVGSKLASIELFPYHSQSFGGGAWLNRLPSVQLARSYVHDSILPKVKDKEAILIVTRKVKFWDIPDINGVINYSSGQARGAHLTPNSPGGKAILEFLGVKLES